MFHPILVLWLLGLSSLAFAQAAKIPKEKIPQGILDQVRLIQADFTSMLARDCPSQGCYPRGCVYANHEVVTMQGDQILPGLVTEGKARSGGDPQYLLTSVSCEFAFDEVIAENEIQNLTKRLSTKLSNGVLKVAVKSMAMPMVFNSSVEKEKKMSTIEEWQRTMVDHFSWILAGFLGVGSFLVGVWAWRRLGKDSKEAELRHLMFQKKMELDALKAAEGPKPKPLAVDEDELWRERLEKFF